jgi:hypothetical protein
MALLMKISFLDVLLNSFDFFFNFISRLIIRALTTMLPINATMLLICTKFGRETVESHTTRHNWQVQSDWNRCCFLVFLLQFLYGKTCIRPDKINAFGAVFNWFEGRSLEINQWAMEAKKLAISLLN